MCVGSKTVKQLTTTMKSSGRNIKVENDLICVPLSQKLIIACTLKKNGCASINSEGRHPWQSALSAAQRGGCLGRLHGVHKFNYSKGHIIKEILTANYFEGPCRSLCGP